MPSGFYLEEQQHAVFLSPGFLVETPISTRLWTGTLSVTDVDSNISPQRHDSRQQSYSETRENP